MATSQPALSAGRGLDAVRITLLQSDGSRDCNKTDGTAYTLCPVSIAVAVEEDAGETQTIRCGDGTVFATVSTADSVTNLTLTLTLASVDIEMIALATGAALLTDTGSGDNIGWSGGESENTIPTEVHAWQQARAGNSQSASPYDYWHYAWPSVKWAYRQPNVEEGFGNGTAQLVGKVEGNLNLGNGSFLDIPVEAFESSDHLQARWRASDQPESDSSPYNNSLGGGYIDTPACAS